MVEVVFFYLEMWGSEFNLGASRERKDRANDDRTERSGVKGRMKRGSEVVMKKFSEILLILF